LSDWNYGIKEIEAGLSAVKGPPAKKRPLLEKLQKDLGGLSDVTKLFDAYDGVSEEIRPSLTSPDQIRSHCASLGKQIGAMLEEMMNRYKAMTKKWIQQIRRIEPLLSKLVGTFTDKQFYLNNLQMELEKLKDVSELEKAFQGVSESLRYSVTPPPQIAQLCEAVEAKIMGIRPLLDYEVLAEFHDNSITEIENLLPASGSSVQGSKSALPASASALQASKNTPPKRKSFHPTSTNTFQASKNPVSARKSSLSTKKITRQGSECSHSSSKSDHTKTQIFLATTKEGISMKMRPEFKVLFQEIQKLKDIDDLVDAFNKIPRDSKVEAMVPEEIEEHAEAVELKLRGIFEQFTEQYIPMAEEHLKQIKAIEGSLSRLSPSAPQRRNQLEEKQRRLGDLASIPELREIFEGIPDQLRTIEQTPEYLEEQRKLVVQKCNNLIMGHYEGMARKRLQQFSELDESLSDHMTRKDLSAKMTKIEELSDISELESEFRAHPNASVDPELTPESITSLFLSVRRKLERLLVLLDEYEMLGQKSLTRIGELETSAILGTSQQQCTFLDGKLSELESLSNISEIQSKWESLPSDLAPAMTPKDVISRCDAVTKKIRSEIAAFDWGPQHQTIEEPFEQDTSTIKSNTFHE
jgi:hypothetical protein